MLAMASRSLPSAFPDPLLFEAILLPIKDRSGLRDQHCLLPTIRNSWIEHPKETIRILELRPFRISPVGGWLGRIIPAISRRLHRPAAESAAKLVLTSTGS